MKRFDEFNIKAPEKGFIGDKIKIARILDREIIVLDFKIEDSKHFLDKGNGKCLHLQISINDEKHIVFTGSCGLIETIIQVPKEDFPFTTIIRKENDRFKFT
jgi:hypothetical protein